MAMKAQNERKKEWKRKPCTLHWSKEARESPNEESGTFLCKEEVKRHRFPQMFPPDWGLLKK